MRLIAFAAALAALTAGSAAAATYQATGITIEDAAAIVEIIPENRADIDVAITPGAALGAPRVSVEGARVRIDGDLRLTGCSAGPQGERVRVQGRGWVRRQDLPRIVIRTPQTIDVALGAGVFARVGASQGGRLAVTGCGDTDVGAVRGDLRLALTGSGDVNLAAVSGDLSASLTGSGDLEATSAGGDAELRLTGSGDLTIGRIGGALNARVTGSGDVQTGDVGRGAELVLTGSGDVAVRDVRGDLSAQITGSGGVNAQSANGASATLRSTSSGEVIVRGGRVERLIARTTGSGGVRFDGAAEIAEVVISGSGDVTIAEAARVERLVDNGSGTVRVGR